MKKYFFFTIAIGCLLFVQMQSIGVFASEDKDDIGKTEWDFDNMTKLEKDVWSIAVRDLHVGDPNKGEQLKSYAEKNKIPIEEINNILMGYLKNGLKASPDDQKANYLFNFAIGNLGELRCKDALPFLKETALADKDSLNDDMAINRRRCAIRSIVKIGNDDLISFAELVLEDKHRYADLDRGALYEELSRQYLKEGLPKNDENMSVLVRQFLTNALTKEQDKGNIKFLRKILKKEAR